MDHPFPIDITSLMNLNIEESIAAAEKERLEIEQKFARDALPLTDVGTSPGPVHAASLQVWNKVAELADVPNVETDLIASIPSELLDDELFCWSEVKPLDPVRHACIIEAINYAKAGGYWRTDICAPSAVKGQLSETGSFEVDPYFSLDDPRIIDMHYGLPTIDILGRPLLTPVRVGPWPVEFRVFFGGQATEDSAVSFYYPQAGKFAITPALKEAAELARSYGSAIYAKRNELGLTPWLPPGKPDPNIGATIDFMLTEERGLVMIDAGPGYGAGAHPCCFIDCEVAGIRWALDDGVKPR